MKDVPEQQPEVQTSGPRPRRPPAGEVGGAGMRRGLLGCAWFAVWVPPVLLGVGALITWGVIELLLLGRPENRLRGHELPWLPLLLMYASAAFVVFMGRRQMYLGSLQAGKEIRFALGLYLIVLYAVGLYHLSQPFPSQVVVAVPEVQAQLDVAMLDDFKRAITVLTFVFVTPVVVVGAVLITGVWRYWVFWKPTPEDATRVSVLGTFAVLAFLTETFALHTAFELGGDSLAAIEYYLWHLADAIPVLKVPATLNWTPDLEFASTTAGARLLAYKILVIIPVIKLARVSIERRRSGAADRGVV